MWRRRTAKVTPIKADRLISAVGVQGNIENLGLEALGVKTDRGCIVTDGYGKTNVAGIYCYRRRRRAADAGPQGRA